MTDWEPWAGSNFHEAMRAESMEKARNALNFLVYRGDKCIAAFREEKDAKAFKGKRRLKIKPIPFYVPFHD